MAGTGDLASWYTAGLPDASGSFSGHLVTGSFTVSELEIILDGVAQKWRDVQITIAPPAGFTRWHPTPCWGEAVPDEDGWHVRPTLERS